MAMLEVNSLSIQFGGLHAVDNFNMSIEKGKLYGLIGPNGAVYISLQRESSVWTGQILQEKAPLRSTMRESPELSRIFVFLKRCRCWIT